MEEKKQNINVKNKSSRSLNSKSNPMRDIKIEKVVLSVGGKGDDLEKGVKLLNMLTGKKPAKMKSKKPWVCFFQNIYGLESFGCYFPLFLIANLVVPHLVWR